LSEITRVTDRQTDRQTDRILIAIPRLHYMQRGKNSYMSFRLVSKSVTLNDLNGVKVKVKVSSLDKF